MYLSWLILTILQFTCLWWGLDFKLWKDIISNLYILVWSITWIKSTHVSWGDRKKWWRQHVEEQWLVNNDQDPVNNQWVPAIVNIVMRIKTFFFPWFYKVHGEMVLFIKKILGCFEVPKPTRNTLLNIDSQNLNFFSCKTYFTCILYQQFNSRTS